MFLGLLKRYGLGVFVKRVFVGRIRVKRMGRIGRIRVLRVGSKAKD